MAAEPQPQTQPRLPLSRDRILRAALEIADDSGIESLTMRKLGQELGFEAMSLYNHVKNKDDLLDGMLDLVLAETEAPSSVGEWDEAVRASAISVHAAFRRHPWSCSLVMAPNRIRPARFRYMDELLGRIRRAGFTADQTYHAYHVLDGHIFGFSLWELSHSTYSDADISMFVSRVSEIVPPDVYPHLNEHAHQHLTKGPLHDVSAFEFGLDLILDGLRRLLAS
jgi:AcrR family transcriptional regulator